MRAICLLEDGANECWVSSASAWEIAIKVRLGNHRLDWPLASLEGVIEEAGFRALPVTMGHATATGEIDSPHADPFDRVLLAQCEVETLRLLTADAALKKLPVAVAC